MKEINLNQKLKKMTTLLILWSILGVIAVPVMIVALVNGNWFIAVPGITLVVSAFYGLPIAWVRWPVFRKYCRMVESIREDGVRDVRELALAFDEKERGMRDMIARAFSKGYLRGFKWDLDRSKLVPVVVEAKQKGKCEYCGATILPDAVKCEYCGGRV